MSSIIAGIHTGIGKTICSAVICQATGYDYWKPVQAGNLDDTDSLFIKHHVTNPSCRIHPETFLLKTPASPHYAAAIENIEIKKEAFQIPETKNQLIIETAGGLMSPLGNQFLNIDLIVHLNLPVILVSNNYLGSINHSLMSIEVLQKRNCKITGLVFCKEPNEVSQSYILEYSKIPLLFTIPVISPIDSRKINTVAKEIKKYLQ
jgi:dethiobiotin synthetase